MNKHITFGAAEMRARLHSGANRSLDLPALA
jgi:hypothetical protein